MTTTTACKTIRLDRPANEGVAFAHKDAKGRTIGCIVERETVEAIALTADERTFCTYRMLVPGILYTACVEASRDGRRYGSSQRTKFFPTEVEREAFITKRITASAKAAQKKAAAL